MKTTRPLHEIASDIEENWLVPSWGALPYLRAMKTLNKASDYFGQDVGWHIVNYFLANATTWRGPEARRIKGELRNV